MNVDTTLEASTQLAEGRQPRVSALNHPAVAPESIIALDALASDAITDSAAPEVSVASRIVVALGTPSHTVCRRWAVCERSQKTERFFHL